MNYPRPSWRPDAVENTGTVADRLLEYTDRRRAFAVFRFGTAVFSDSSLPRIDEDYERTLSAVVQQSPDFKVVPMKDGNLLVRFAGPVTGLVLRDFFAIYHSEIRQCVERGGLLSGEQLLTPGQHQEVEDHYYAGLYARAKLYRDVEEMQIEYRFVPEQRKLL